MLRFVFVAFYIVNVCSGQSGVHFLKKSQEHLAVCYNDTRYSLNRQLPPFSLENLLTIIEKIENNPFFNNNRAVNIATYILKRFRVDGITSKKLERDEAIPKYEVDNKEGKRGVSILKVIPSIDFQYAPVDFLTNDEKCALHWMLSHSINKTRLKEEDDIYWRPTPAPYSRKRRQNPNRQPEVKSEYSQFPRESGVVYTSSGEAIAIGSVVAGISLMRDTSGAIRLSDIEKEIDSSTGINDLLINRLDAATYAFNLALDATNGDYLVGPRGFWNDSTCPTEYTLNKLATSITDAVLFGSFDGYFIGKSVGRIYGEQILLSQILRMYYGDGFKNNRENRACNRMKQLKDAFDDGSPFENMVTEVSKAILIMGYALGGGTLQLNPADYAARELFKNIKSAYTDSDSYNFPSQQQCEVLDSNIEPKIYPLVYIYVMIDRQFFQTQSRYDEMAAFVTKTASYLDISPKTSQIGLYVEDKNLFDSVMPINTSLGTAEWKCNVQKFDIRSIRFSAASDQTLETIRLLKQKLIDIKTQNRNRKNAGTPGDVVLFLRSSAVPNSETVTWEMEHFRKDHPEITIIGAARNKGDVEPFIGRDNNENFLQFSSGSIVQMHNIADAFYKNYLRRVGATIYYPYCEVDARSSHDIVGFLRPFSRQFHIMPPSAFNLSKELKIDVRAQGIALEACISRDATLFKSNKRPSGDTQCKEILSTSGTPNNLFYGNPCSEYDAGYCKSIYIQIKRKDQTESGDCYSQISGENVCRTFDDVRYTIRVEDGRCSGCTVKITALLFISCFITLLMGQF